MAMPAKQRNAISRRMKGYWAARKAADAAAVITGKQLASASDILRGAAAIIDDRATKRDQLSGERSMARCVAAFNAIYGAEMTEVQGWQFMSLLKMVRGSYGVYMRDDHDDQVAYAALAAEAAANKA
jgi:hypothetical protein